MPEARGFDPLDFIDVPRQISGLASIQRRHFVVLQHLQLGLIHLFIFDFGSTRSVHKAASAPQSGNMRRALPPGFCFRDSFEKVDMGFGVDKPIVLFDL